MRQLKSTETQESNSYYFAMKISEIHDKIKKQGIQLTLVHEAFHRIIFLISKHENVAIINV